MNIYQRIIAARKQFAPIPKNGYNPHYKSKFAKLDDILDAVESPLISQGILIINRIENGVLLTELVAEDGAISSAFPLPDTQDPQKIGAAISYGRRYNLSALLNLRDEDDDGEAANGRGRSQPSANGKRYQSISGGDGEAIGRLMQRSDALLARLGWTPDEGRDLLSQMFPGRKGRRQLSAIELDAFCRALESSASAAATSR